MATIESPDPYAGCNPETVEADPLTGEIFCEPNTDHGVAESLLVLIAAILIFIAYKYRK